MRNKNCSDAPEDSASLDELLPPVVKQDEVDKCLSIIEYDERKIYLTSYISDESVLDIVRKIISYNAEDKGIPVEERRPIMLYISSDGGDVNSGYELIDIIIQSKTPVFTVNICRCYSMAALIIMAGHKRFSTANSTFLLHDGDATISDCLSKFLDTAKHICDTYERTKDFVLSYSNITEDEYEKNSRREWYMFAKEAKKLGIVDSIIGIDCDIDEVC